MHACVQADLGSPCFAALEHPFGALPTQHVGLLTLLLSGVVHA